jgi:integrase/recombinase XerD
MQQYITLYMSSLTSDNSKKAVVKNLRAALKRTDFADVIDEAAVLGFDWHKMTLSNYSELRKALIDEGKAASYINTILTIVRQVLNWAFISDQLTELAYEKIKQVIKSVRSNSKKQARAAASDDEVDLSWLSGQLDNLTNLSTETDLGALPKKTIAQLISSVGHTTNVGIRNRAIFMCMSHAGLRREEVAELRLEDICFARTGATDSFIKIIGKGSKLRDVPMSADLHKSLLAYAHLVMNTDNKKKSSAFFRKTNIIGKVLDNGLSNTGVYKIIRKMGEDDGVNGLHPHSLRHYFATRLLLSGRDLFEVAKLLGHRNVDTTRRYDDRGFDTLQSAVAHV